jgi:hypothetical protein
MGAYLASRRLGLFEQVTVHMLSHGESISNARKTWTLEACLSSAKKFSSRIEWSKQDSPAYQAARKNGWYAECTAHMPLTKKPNGYWDLAKCLIESSKYKSIKDWVRHSSVSYGVAQKNPKWFQACTAHMDRLWEKKWIPDSIKEDAKRFQTLSEWAQSSPGAYSAGLKLGLIAEATAHMPQNPRWIGVATLHRIFLAYDLEYVEEKTFPDCKDKRKLPFDFYLPRFNLLIEHHGIQHQRGWQGRGGMDIQRRDEIKRTYAKAHQIELLEINGWESKTESALEDVVLGRIQAIAPNDVFVKRGLSPEEVAFTVVRYKFDIQSLTEIAKNFVSRTEFKRGNEPAYNFACRHGLIDEVCVHMMSKSEAQARSLTKWTKERVLASAKKYRTARDWSKGEGSAYNAARKNSWLQEASAHFLSRKLS